MISRKFFLFVYSAWSKVGDFTKTNITGTAATKETETDSEPVKGIEITKKYYKSNLAVFNISK